MLRTALPEIITATVPGPKAQALIDRRANAVPSAIRCVYPVAIARGEGAMVEDLDGNRFLDWIGGVGVLNIGYSHPEIISSVKAQAEQYFHGMFNIVTHEGYVALAEKLAQIVPVQGDKKKVFFANSGAEADENAVKIARAYTNDPEILIMDEPFGALDAQTRYAMEEEVARIWQQEKRTVIFVTNNIEEACYLGDRIILFSERPATIKEIYVNDLPRPPDMISEEFMKLRTKISDNTDLAI